MSTYSKEFQDKMVAKVLHTEGSTVIQLASKSGVSKTTLYKWINKYKQQSGENMNNAANLKLKTLTARPQNWSAANKLSAVYRNFLTI